MSPSGHLESALVCHSPSWEVMVPLVDDFDDRRGDDTRASLPWKRDALVTMDGNVPWLCEEGSFRSLSLTAVKDARGEDSCGHRTQDGRVPSGGGHPFGSSEIRFPRANPPVHESRRFVANESFSLFPSPPPKPTSHQPTVGTNITTATTTTTITKARTMLASKPIPIQPTSSLYHAHGSSSSPMSMARSSPYDDESMELATWRLYHRIVEHRLKNPLSVECTEETMTRSHGSETLLSALASPGGRTTPRTFREEMRYPDEIFDMDLE